MEPANDLTKFSPRHPLRLGVPTLRRHELIKKAAHITLQAMDITASPPIMVKQLHPLANNCRRATSQLRGTTLHPHALID
jgi:hypothetical protein